MFMSFTSLLSFISVCSCCTKTNDERGSKEPFTKTLSTQQTRWPAFTQGRNRTLCFRSHIGKLGKLEFVLFLSIIFSLFTMVHPAILDKPISLSDQPLGSISFDIEGEALELVISSDGLVLYTSDIENARQIKAVSKVFDFASLGIATYNAKESLKFLSSQDQLNSLEDFLLLGQYEYHISAITMSYNKCPIYCASKMSKMIDNPVSFYKLTSHLMYNRIWVDTRTSVTESFGNVFYQIHLNNSMLFPKNTLSARDKVRMYTYHNYKKTEIYSIKEMYTYYEDMLGLYWTKNPYELHVAISRYSTISIYIPESPMHYVSSDYREQCACFRKPTRSATVFRELKNAYNLLEIQVEKLDLGIEKERVDSDNPQIGTLPALVYPFLAQEQRKENRVPYSKFYTLDDLLPLIPDDHNQDLLASGMIYYGATKIGPPVVLGLLKPTLADLAKDLGAKLYEKLSPTDESVHEFVKVSGLGLHSTNYSLILDYNHIDSFSRNITSNMIETQTLLENLTLTNEVFGSFLTDQVENVLLGMAQRQIPDKIDTNIPILGVLSRKKSFLLVDFYFSVFCTSRSITNYEAVALPHYVSENTLMALDVPKVFSTQPPHNGFIFPMEVQDQKLMDGCINSFLSTASDLDKLCGRTPFTHQRLVLLFTLKHQRVMLAKGMDAVLKISCPNEKLMVTTLLQDVLVFLVPDMCDIDLTTSAGLIVKPAAASSLSPSTLFLRPKLLFTYDMDYALSTDAMQTIFIVILSALIGLFLIAIGGLVYFVIKRKVSAELVDTPSLNLDTSSQLTIQMVPTQAQQS